MTARSRFSTLSLVAVLGLVAGCHDDGGGEPGGDLAGADLGGMPPDVTACGAGTYEYPFRSGTCIDDPCDPDPCGGTGTCSNVTGEAVCTACTYFVDAMTGLDTNDGRSPTTAWQTLSRLGTATFVAGDNVCLRRGQTFRGAIVAKQSGTPDKPIEYGNYGPRSDAAPVVSALVPLTGWTQVKDGIWKAPCPACGARVEVVTIDGVPHAMGRYPNLSAPDGGWLHYESVIGPTTADKGGLYLGSYTGKLGIVDDDLPSSPSWAGAEVVMRKINYILDRARVTAHNGTTLEYENPMGTSVYVGLPGWGYFLQDSLQTLDEPGEWYYDAAAHELDVFFGSAGPGAAVVEASALPNAFSTTKTDLVVDGLELRGANEMGVDLDQAKRVRLVSVRVDMSGLSGVRMSSTDGVTLEASSIDHSGDEGVLLHHTPMNTIVRNNWVQRSGVVRGAGARMTDTEAGNHSGIGIFGSTAAQNALVEGNVVNESGYNGIHFVASGVTVKDNLVTNFTHILDDGGGIYTWRGGEVYTDRKIVGNVVLDGPGAPDGKAPSGVGSSSCIYLDNATSNIEVTGNTGARCSRAAILENYARDCTISGNTFADSRTQAEVWSLQNAVIANQTSTDNVFFARSVGQPVMIVSAQPGQIEAFGTWDHNHYVRPTADDLVIDVTIGGTERHNDSLEAWKAAYGLDASSSKTPVVLLPYEAPTPTSGPLVQGGDFETALGPFVIWSGTNNVTGTRDTTSKLTGVGSLELSFKTAVRADSMIYESSPGFGPVDAGKTYLLRVSTLGTGPAGIVGATLRQTKSPFGPLSPVQRRSIGPARKDHEFVFVAPTADPTGSFQVSVDERSGTTYLDDLQLYEATVTPRDPDDSIRFEVNTRTTPKTISLDGTWVDARGTSYPGTITLPPMSSAVLLKPAP